MSNHLETGYFDILYLNEDLELIPIYIAVKRHNLWDRYKTAYKTIGENGNGPRILVEPVMPESKDKTEKCFPVKSEYQDKTRWHWELAENGWADYVCPCCGYRVNVDIHVQLDYSYCPNCGVKLK